MIRGKGVPKHIESEERIENVDIFPTLLELTDISYDKKNISGQLPKVLGGEEKRKIAFSESIFPGQTYKATIVDGIYKYYFETKHPVSDAGNIPLKSYKTKLIAINGEFEVTNKPDLIDEYTNYVLQIVEDSLQ
jgi:hypothetical protein